MTRDDSEWDRILTACGVSPIVAVKWAPVFSDTINDGSFSAGDADLAPFLGQILTESQMLTKLEESLNYSAERLMAVWPTRFPTMGDALLFAHSPEALANKVYGGRMGNTEPGDGYQFRGRSLIMVTGRAGYAALGDLCGQDFTSVPDLLEQPHFALEAAIHWWEGKIPDSMLSDTVSVTRKVNGGLIGLADRDRLTKAAQGALA